MADKLLREFDIAQDDIEYLNARNFQWETIRDGNSMWLLVHDFSIPEGYNIRTAVAAVSIPGDYLMAGLDMVFFKPALFRTDGISIGATTHFQNVRGESYQRWSRHRTEQNPWRPGVDDIAAHLALVEEWLLRELPR